MILMHLSQATGFSVVLEADWMIDRRFLGMIDVDSPTERVPLTRDSV
jgi:hypothetical protein